MQRLYSGRWGRWFKSSRPDRPLFCFIRLRQNTLQLARGMNGEANRVEAL